MGNLTPELAECRDEARDLAASYGLDFFDVIFELVDHDELNMIAAYGGFPTRYPHWRFGMEYEQLTKSYAYGLSKIYELVINNDPCYAYLMRGNSLTDQKLVMAHVYGHSDFFKNNAWFSKTPRKMMDEMANHGARIRRYMDRYGQGRVEDFIDSVQSLDNLIDVYAPFITRGPVVPTRDSEPEEEVGRIAAKDYMERYINPREYLEEREEVAQRKRTREKSFPVRPVRDVLGFLRDFAPLETWEQDVLDMLRDEAYYFAPQGMTKIMNEGWAVYWHSTLMTRHMLDAAEVISYCDTHSGTLSMQPGQINPYKIGVELYRHIEERWDKGRFGAEYQACDDPEVRKRWDTGVGLGREKIFEARKIYNDITFLDEFITPEFADELKLYVYGIDPTTGRKVIIDRDYRKVKDQILDGLTNFGQPIIRVVDANWSNRGELYLVHEWTGADLQFEQALETLGSLHSLWKRPVHIETCDEGKGRLLSFDGEEATIVELAGSEEQTAVGAGDDESVEQA